MGGSAVGIFWITQVLGKMYYVPSADEDVGGSVVDILRKTEAIAICSTYGPPPKRGWYGGCFVFCFLGFDIFCCELWRQGGRAGDN